MSTIDSEVNLQKLLEKLAKIKRKKGLTLNYKKAVCTVVYEIVCRNGELQIAQKKAQIFNRVVW